jgi:type VI secretion system protein ImpL
MKAIIKLLTNRWFLAVLGLFFISCIIWFYGPYLGFGQLRPFESEWARAFLILVVFLIWGTRKLIAYLKAVRSEKEIVEGIVAAEGEPPKDLSAEEVQVLRERFEEAVDVLRRSKRGRGKANLYELPWYVIIGPPGSGKTTALRNSGLNFPLADRLGKEAIQGVGGTRNCDWWFTDQAVLLDTAGRYVTQDSHADIDSAAWSGFLDLLKKYRKRRPINGVFVSISLADLMTQDEAERQRHVQAIRSRIEEIDTHFGIRFPVYVLLTKCDLVAGFTEFFENLGREDREQVWGATFALEDRSGERSPIDTFSAEFDALVRRLNERLIWRLSQERDVSRRAMIYRFPKQMASLRGTLEGFLEDVFSSSRYSQAPMVRGVYFTSGTQEGVPIDRMLGTLAKTFELSPQSVPAPTGPGKSFFISDVLQKVAFRESELAGTNRRLELQRAWLQRAAYAGTIAIAVLAALLWVLSYARNSDYIRDTGELAATADAMVAGISPNNVDPLETLPALNALRSLTARDKDAALSTTFLHGFGLSQKDKLTDIAEESYRRVLTQAFLPRLMLRMEQHMTRGGPTADYAYAALQAYISLDSREYYDAEMINGFLRVDWVDNLRRETSTEQREQLRTHLTALLEQRPTPLPLPLDEALVERTQRELRRMPLEERIYGRILRIPVDEPSKGFDIRTAAGSNAEIVFVRKSGASLSEGLDPLFTKIAYQNTFKSMSKDLTRKLLSETWVLGQEEELESADLDALLEKVRALYLEDFAERYTNLILDIDLAPFTNAEEASRIFRILSQDDSPLLLLLEAIERETTLDSTDEGPSALEEADSAIRRAEREARKLIGVGEAQSAVSRTLRTANLVERRFEGLNKLVKETDGQPRPIDHLLGLIREMYEFATVVANENIDGSIPLHVVQQGRAIIQELEMEAESQPELVGSLLTAATTRTEDMAFGGALAYLNQLWRSDVLPFCQQAIEGRYPIRRDSTNEIRIDDFSRFFGYNQIIDSFFNEHLRTFVDTSQKPWKRRISGNSRIRLSDAALQTFERADAIRRTFFGFGGAQPSVGFNMVPIDMDATIGRFVLNLEGTEISWDHGPQVPTFMQWPGPNPGSEVRLEMRSAQTGRTSMLRKRGPWAWFRILDESDVRETDRREHFEVEFNVEGNHVTYELIARSAYNPFRFAELERFSCPGRL